MPDSFGAEQNCIEEIHVRRSSVTERFPGVENERDVKPEFLLTFHKTLERFEIIDERFQRVLVPNEVKACAHVSASS